MRSRNCDLKKARNRGRSRAVNWIFIAMLDGWVRIRIDPLLDRAAKPIAAAGVPANGVTVAACASASSPLRRSPDNGISLVWRSSCSAGSATASTARWRGFPARPISAAFSISCSISLFYGAVPIGFVLADPPANAVAGAVLSFPSTSMARASSLMRSWPRSASSRRACAGPNRCSSPPGLPRRPKPSRCLAPSAWCRTWFPEIAYAFAALTFYTALSRIVLAARTFR